jgi:UrcA family protein
MNTRSNRFNVITLTLTSLLGFGAAVGAANCARAAAAPSLTVSYRDLNLSQPKDVRTLYRRLEHAASNVCMQVPERELARHLAYSRCYNAALDSAVMAVRSPELLALDRAERNGRQS